MMWPLHAILQSLVGEGLNGGKEKPVAVSYVEAEPLVSVSSGHYYKINNHSIAVGLMNDSKRWCCTS